MEHEDLIVSMKGIQKSFGGVHALTDGELTLRKGEVLGLIGENGAGKSTLMKILSGVYQADAGVMLVDGKEVHYHEPRQALHDGICMIYQELNLVQHLSVGDNIFIGRESQKGWKLDRTKDNRRAEELLKELELDVSPNTTVSSLTVAKQQMIEIAKGIIYIEDCVEAIAKISLADHNPHAEYNIGGGEVIPYTRIIDKARKLFPTAPIHVGPGDLGYDNLGALSVQRAFEDFGWKPRFSIEQGMEQYMNWLKNF